MEDEAEFETGVASRLALGEFGKESGKVADDVAVTVVGRLEGVQAAGAQLHPATSLGEVENTVDELIGGEEFGVGGFEHGISLMAGKEQGKLTLDS